MKLTDSKTFTNLAKAFAGECQARTRYEFIEYGARKEGYKAIADIVDKVAYQEFNHARMFYSFIQTADLKKPIDNIDIESGYPFKQKWNLLDNFAFAAEDEKFEAEKIYPAFGKIAKEEGFDQIAGLFFNVAEIEAKHQALFEEIYRQMKSGTLYKKDQKVIWRCPACGYEEEAKEAFETCPVCQEKQGSVQLHLDGILF